MVVPTYHHGAILNPTLDSIVPVGPFTTGSTVPFLALVRDNGGTLLQATPQLLGRLTSRADVETQLLCLLRFHTRPFVDTQHGARPSSKRQEKRLEDYTDHAAILILAVRVNWSKGPVRTFIVICHVPGLGITPEAVSSVPAVCRFQMIGALNAG